MDEVIFNFDKLYFIYRIVHFQFANIYIWQSVEYPLHLIVLPVDNVPHTAPTFIVDFLVSSVLTVCSLLHILLVKITWLTKLLPRLLSEVGSNFTRVQI